MKIRLLALYLCGLSASSLGGLTPAKKNMDIVGHQKIVEYLKNSIAKDRLAHIYLFYGPEHSGKTTLAQYFAQALFCPYSWQEKKFIGPCGKCTACRRVLNNTNPDFFYLNGEEKSSLGINDIRRLKMFFNLRPFEGQYKVALIDKAEKLTEQAINSALKIFEETPKGGVIILTASDISRFPATLFSRVQILRFHLPAKREIISWLNEEHLNSLKKTKEVLFFSSYRPGLIARFLKNQDEFSLFQEHISQVIQILEKRDLEEFISFFQKQEDILSKLDILLWAVRIMLLNKLNLKKELPDFFQINSQSYCFSLEQLTFLTKKILRTKAYLSSNVNPNLALGDLFLSLPIT